METEKIIKELEITTEQAITAAQAVPEWLWNLPLEGNRWSAAQVMEHIVITAGLVAGLIDRQGKACTKRQPDAKITEMETLLTDDNLKFSANDPMLPGDTLPARIQQIEIFRSIQGNILSLAKSLDINQLVHTAKHPKFGELTRKEWIWYHILHTRRHTRQLQRISQETDIENVYS